MGHPLKVVVYTPRLTCSSLQRFFASLERNCPSGHMTRLEVRMLKKVRHLFSLGLILYTNSIILCSERKARCAGADRESNPHRSPRSCESHRPAGPLPLFPDQPESTQPAAARRIDYFIAHALWGLRRCSFEHSADWAAACGRCVAYLVCLRRQPELLAKRAGERCWRESDHTDHTGNAWRTGLNESEF